MKCFLLATAIAGLAIAPALAQTMGTSPSGSSSTSRTVPCLSNNAGPAATVDRSGTGSGGNKPGTTETSEASGSLSHSNSGTAPNIASSTANGCQ